MSIFQFERILGFVFAIVILAIAAAGGYLWYIENQEIPLQTTTVSETENTQVLEGVYACLPRADGAKGRECTPGIKVGDEYYALDLASVIEAGGELGLRAGEKISVGGTIVPIEEISSDQWKAYSLKGIMRVLEVAREE